MMMTWYDDLSGLVDLIEAVQDYLIELYSQKCLVIEACPTSNVYIAALKDYASHPIFAGILCKRRT